MTSDAGSAALRYPDFKLFVAARFLATVGIQMQSVAVGWQVYELTSDTMDLGYVGLAQFLPAIALALLTGHVADRFDRRLVMQTSNVALVSCSLLLLGVAFAPIASSAKVACIFGVLVLFGTVRAFNGPASSAILRHLVPPEHLGSAIAWSSSAWQIGTIIGPAFGGLLYGWAGHASTVYMLSGVLLLANFGLIGAMKVRTGRMETAAASWESLFAGIRYVWNRKLVLGAISLDLFAVLLGGAVALLPAFARDILQAGPWALGFLRSAPAIGAAIVALVLAYVPVNRHVGWWMFGGVGVFGLGTIVFGLSSNMWLSLAALIVIGASDMVSVNIRHTLVQMATPPSMQGRVAAVNQVFIGASNELGEFESGLTASFFGLVRAVVLGGIGTCVVVAIWAWRFPILRNVDRYEEQLVDDPPATAKQA
jgi:MFS family permease